MSLYLVQHGQSLSKDLDPERGLSTAGAAEVERVAVIAGKHEAKVATIMHSGKKRAQQTAEIFAAELKPAGGVKTRDGLAPLDDVTALTVSVEDNIMLVGHLPFMEVLVSYLITGDTERPVIKFQNGGIVCLDQTETGRWFISWTIVPSLTNKIEQFQAYFV